MTTPAGGGSLTLPDGRVVEYWTGGDAGGRPVLYQPGTPGSRWQGLQAEDSARSAGIRLVAVNRPGYGGSGRTPPGLATVGQDTVALADALDIGRFAVLGASGGGPFALATAVVAPERVRSVGILGGIGPWPEIDGPTETNATDRRRLQRARAGDLAGASRGLQEDAQRAFGSMLALDDPAMVEEFLLGTPASEDDLFTPDTLRIWAADLREALASYDGFVRDNLSWGLPWDIDVRQVVAPAYLWYGELDHMVPVAHGRWLAERVSGGELVVLGGEDHGRTTLGHWNEVFRTLARSR